MKIGLLGLPGCGKTTLARLVAVELSKTNIVEVVDEFARLYLAKFGSITSPAEQYVILEKQIQREMDTKAEILITDSPVILGFNYVIDYSSNSDKDIFYVGEIFKRLFTWITKNPYDILFYIPPVIPPKKDNIRPNQHFDEKWRYKNDVLMRAIPVLFKCNKVYELKSKSLDGRLRECLNYIS